MKAIEVAHCSHLPSSRIGLSHDRLNTVLLELLRSFRKGGNVASDVVTIQEVAWFRRRLDAAHERALLVG